jgi:hypothetical protein
MNRVLAVLCLVLAMASQALSKNIVLKWTKGRLAASGLGGGRRLDKGGRALYVKSGDKVLFRWRRETMGLYGFYSEAHYRKCSKARLNYMKNTRSSGDFWTKANRAGWRYYAHISKAADGACKYERKGCHKSVKGTCQAKIKIHWG